MTEPRSDTTEKLLAIAAETANLSAADVLDSLQCPDWTVRTGQQWELYVDPSIRRLWDSLTDEARTVAFIAAVSQLLDDR